MFTQRYTKQKKMICKIVTILITILSTTIAKEIKAADYKTKPVNYKELGDHTMVTDSEVFPYVVAILRKATYISAGALLDDSWVLTAADALFLMRESSRVLRIRLGSINNKKGGVVMPIKYFHIHPYFDDNIPQYDIALIRLSQSVRLTPKLNPIKLQTKSRMVLASHFIVTGWQAHSKVSATKEIHHHEPMEVIKRRRLLSVFHLHPTDPEECIEQLSMCGLNHTDAMMCLDLAVGTDPCERQGGAPVVLNGNLWGIISSWKPEDCDLDPGPTLVTLVSANDIRSWILATRRGRKWTPYQYENKTTTEKDNEIFSKDYYELRAEEE